MAAIGVLAADYRLITGHEFITSYEAPILYEAPAYETYFCSNCGSPTPPTDPTEFFEIPAGLLDSDPDIKPDKHIFIEFTPDWDTISDELPQFSLKELYELRHNQPLPEGFEIKTHYHVTSS